MVCRSALRGFFMALVAPRLRAASGQSRLLPANAAAELRREHRGAPYAGTGLARALGNVLGLGVSADDGVRGHGAALSMRSLAIAKYCSSFSMPMNLRPVFMQATPVVPLPMQLSRTVSS